MNKRARKAKTPLVVRKLKSYRVTLMDMRTRRTAVYRVPRANSRQHAFELACKTHREQFRVPPNVALLSAGVVELHHTVGSVA